MAQTNGGQGQQIVEPPHNIYPQIPMIGYNPNYNGGLGLM